MTHGAAPVVFSRQNLSAIRDLMLVVLVIVILAMISVTSMVMLTVLVMILAITFLMMVIQHGIKNNGCNSNTIIAASS